jgi:hypothetical protein
MGLPPRALEETSLRAVLQEAGTTILPTRRIFLLLYPSPLSLLVFSAPAAD